MIIIDFPPRDKSLNEVMFRSPGHTIETIFSKTSQEFGPEFLENIQKEKLLELSSAIADFVTDNCFFVLKNSKNQVIRDKVIRTEFDLGSLKIIMEKEPLCFIARIHFKEKSKTIEFSIHGYSLYSNVSYGSSNGSVKEREYEMLTYKARNEKNKIAYPKKHDFLHVIAFRCPGHAIEQILGNPSRKFGSEFLEEIQKEKLLELASAIADFITDNFFFYDKEAIGDRVIRTEFDLGSLKLTMERESHCFIARIKFKELLQIIEFVHRGYSFSNNVPYVANEGPLRERMYEVLSFEERDWKIKKIRSKL